MNIYQICLISIAGVCLALMVKEGKREYAVFIGFTLSIFLLLVAVKELISIFQWGKELAAMLGNCGAYLSILFKMIGIAYITEFTSNLCKDAGFSSISNGVEMISKILLCMIGLPIVEEVITLISELM